MSLNIKNERTVALVRELARRTGLSQTGAIEDAVKSRLAQLDDERDSTRRRRDDKGTTAQRLIDELHRSLTDAERTQLKAAEGQLYDDVGLPA